jgi:hypothetical protein
MSNRGGRGEFPKHVWEHLIVILVSIVLCLGGVYYWSHVKTEWVANKSDPNAPLHKQTSLVLSAWTLEDTQKFKECVKEHILDWKHYMPGAGPSAVFGQLAGVVTGNVCSSKRPPTDQASLMHLVTSDGFLKAEECNEMRKHLRSIRSTQTPMSPKELMNEELYVGPTPTTLPSCVLSASELKNWDDLTKSLKPSPSGSVPLPLPPESWHMMSWHDTPNARGEHYY